MDRVSYLGPEGRTRSLPIEWTNLAAVDALVALGAGRAPFRLSDLLALNAIVRRTLGRRSEEGAP